jgi:hypothetical protein
MRTHQVYPLLTLIAASTVGARIMTAPGAYSVNDQSRWATIRALVDTGRYSIGYREEYPDGTHRDFGIVALKDWQSVDVVLHPTTKRFYSSKPTLLPTVLAGEYWIIRNLLGLNFRRDRLVVTRTILMTINLLPFVLYLIVLARLLDRLGTTDWGRLFVFATAGFGTFVSGFSGSLNNHTVAAIGGLFAVYHCLRIQLDNDRRGWRFGLVGVLAGWALCNDLPAAALAAGILLWLWRFSPRDTLRLAVPGMALPVAAYLVTQYLAVGTIAPTYAQERWYTYADSYWLHPVGIDAADENKIIYAANLLVGHTGILSLTPALLLGWIGMVRTSLGADDAIPADSAARTLALLTLAMTVITFGFYVMRTHSYGGQAAGPRWFFWLVPLWLLTMAPEADRWAVTPWRRRLAYVFLAFSIGTASYALANPWQHSWLLTLFRRWGMTSY